VKGGGHYKAESFSGALERRAAKLNEFLRELIFSRAPRVIWIKKKYGSNF
jgi:hypothetical protein